MLFIARSVFVSIFRFAMIRGPVFSPSKVYSYVCLRPKDMRRSLFRYRTLSFYLWHANVFSFVTLGSREFGHHFLRVYFQFDPSLSFLLNFWCTLTLIIILFFFLRAVSLFLAFDFALSNLIMCRPFECIESRRLASHEPPPKLCWRLCNSL